MDWEPEVASFAVESRGVTVLLDPLAPPPSERAVWDRLAAAPPEAVVVLKPDHVRDVDLFVRWYGARAFGPWLYWRDDVPRTELEEILPGKELPGGLQAQYDGRGAHETPVYLPEQRALVFADALDRSRRRAARMGDAVARGADAAGPARAARAPVRARPRLPRRAGP